MNADMKWLDNPEVFRVNQLEPHSDHCYYLDYADMKKEKNPLLQSLNGQWEFAYSKNVMERPVDFYKETISSELKLDAESEISLARLHEVVQSLEICTCKGYGFRIKRSLVVDHPKVSPDK